MPSHRAVRSAIAALLRYGGTGLPHTARKLGVSRRSLQRHLAEMGTSYSQLFEEVRADKACHLLAESDTRICDIAARLGFADAGSFSRTFLRVMKTQPRAYRRQQAIRSKFQRRRRTQAGR